MSKTISELRASGQVRRRTEKHTICLDVDLSEEYRQVHEELVAALAALDAPRQQPAGPTRLGTKPKDQKAERALVDEKSEQLDAIAEKMAEFEVEITLERGEPATWNEWAAEHPPRENDPDEQGRRFLLLRDTQHGGRVNFDALVADLGTWVTELNGEQASPEDWAWLAGIASPADLDDVADMVLKMHGGRVNLPKSLKSSLETLLAEFDSSKPETGTPARVASTAGSRSTRRRTSTTPTAGSPVP